MDYDADGADLFVLNLKGYFLTILTFGIYFFWWQKEAIEFYINNISLHKDNETIEFETSVEGGEIFALSIINMFIMMFTLGLGYAWVHVRTLKYIASNIHLSGTIDLDSVKQTENIYKDATGEDIEDMLDMDFVL